MKIPAETSKAHNRRVRENWFDKHTLNPGIDVGCHRDYINHTFRRWDLIFGDGDAQKMEGVPDCTFKTVYCSHVLEHMNDPVEAIFNWYRVLMFGGELIIIVPHRDLYEKKKTLPSNWNVDHKSFWLPNYEDPPDTWGLESVIKLALPESGWELIELREVSEGYIETPPDVHPGGEYSIEAIVRKMATSLSPARES